MALSRIARLALIVWCLMLPSLAWAQDPEMVLLPRNLAQAAVQWMAQPDPTIAVNLHALLFACIQDNPTGGSTVHTGQDQCPAVTSALAARDKEISDLKKQIEVAKPAEKP